MAAIPQPQHQTAAAIYALHEQRRDGASRPYLGASELGEPCARRLWLRLRWVAVEKFEGRMLRLFDTGHREEARALDELRAIGVRVEGQQHEVTFAQGHGAGHLDAAVLGLPEAPKSWHVLDVKTAKTSKFAEMVKHGCAKAQPRYYAQLQTYMGLTKMERSALFVVCKDTDEIHVERVPFNKEHFDGLMQRAEAIIYASEPPAKISDDPSYYVCKLCPFYEQCHGTAAPATNCRTCCHAEAKRDGEGRWYCIAHGKDVPTDFQRHGCELHLHMPKLLENFAEPIDCIAHEDSIDGEQHVVYVNKLTGAQFENGPNRRFTSPEISACADKRALGDPEVMALRESVEGRLVA